MKKTLTIGLLLIVYIAMQAQTTFEKHFILNADMDELGKDVVQTTDGGYIITGVGFNQEEVQPFMLKTDHAGDSIWYKALNIEMWEDMPFRVLEMPNGDLLCGPSSGYFFISEDSHFYLMRTDSAGNTLWEKTFDSEFYDQGTDFIINSSGNILLIGYAVNQEDQTDISLLVAEPDGTEKERFVYEHGQELIPVKIIELAQGGYMVAGAYAEADGVFLQKLDETYTQEWITFHPLVAEFSGDDLSLMELNNGDLALVFSAFDWGTTNDDGHLMRFDGNGNLLNSYPVIQNFSQYYGEAILCDDGNILVTGTALNGGLDSDNMLLYKMTTEGQIIWERYFNMLDYNGGVSLSRTSDNGYVITGFTTGQNWYEKLYLVKTDHEGMISGIGDIQAENLPFSFSPNPASEFINIRFNEHVKSYNLSILDLQGRELKHFIDPPENSISVKDLHPGVYIMKLKTPEKSYAIKFVIGR